MTDLLVEIERSGDILMITYQQLRLRFVVYSIETDDPLV